MLDWNIDHELDATGLTCPEPVMMLHKIVRETQSGETIKVVATDPSTQRDVPQFCQFLGHKLIEQCEMDGVFLFLIQKQ